MGPRRFRRGCSDYGCVCAFVSTASMGPRRFRRGCAQERRPEGLLDFRLQWGRDVSVADVGDGTVEACVDGVASMGPRRFRRGCRARFGLGRPIGSWCFNGAATFPSRM